MRGKRREAQGRQLPPAVSQGGRGETASPGLASRRWNRKGGRREVPSRQSRKGKSGGRRAEECIGPPSIPSFPPLGSRALQGTNRNGGSHPCRNQSRQSSCIAESTSIAYHSLSPHALSRLPGQKTLKAQKQGVGTDAGETLPRGLHSSDGKEKWEIVRDSQSR